MPPELFYKLDYVLGLVAPILFSAAVCAVIYYTGSDEPENNLESFEPLK
jgi:hypothetical protein